MKLNNKLIDKNFSIKKFSISNYDIALGSSMISNVCCLLYIQQQNKQINELIDQNNLLVESVNKLNVDLAKLGEELSQMNSKSTPIYINTSENILFSKPLMFVCLTAATLGMSYYVGSMMLTKVSSLTVPKIISLGSVISKLPIFEQSKEITVFYKELATTLLIEMLNDEILDIKFKTY